MSKVPVPGYAYAYAYNCRTATCNCNTIVVILIVLILIDTIVLQGRYQPIQLKKKAFTIYNTISTLQLYLFCYSCIGMCITSTMYANTIVIPVTIQHKNYKYMYRYPGMHTRVLAWQYPVLVVVQMMQFTIVCICISIWTCICIWETICICICIHDALVSG